MKARLSLLTRITDIAAKYKFTIDADGVPGLGSWIAFYKQHWLFFNTEIGTFYSDCTVQWTDKNTFEIAQKMFQEIETECALPEITVKLCQR